MRFRLRADLRSFALFKRVCQALRTSVSDKASLEQCVLHLTPDRVQFAIKSDSADGVQAFAMLSSSIFSDADGGGGEYRIESNNANRISLRLRLSDLLRATRSGDHAFDFVTVKLTKRGAVPCLTIVAKTEGQTLVEQDVPVETLTQEQFERYAEPEIPRECFGAGPCKAEESTNATRYTSLH